MLGVTALQHYISRTKKVVVKSVKIEFDSNICINM